MEPLRQVLTDKAARRRLHVQVYTNRKGESRVSVIMPLADAEALAQGESAAVDALAQAIAERLMAATPTDRSTE
jgi:hypothetical protein